MRLLRSFPLGALRREMLLAAGGGVDAAAEPATGDVGLLRRDVNRTLAVVVRVCVVLVTLVAPLFPSRGE